LWFSIFTPVLAWIAAQQIGLILAPWICATGRRWVLYPVMGLAFLAAAAGGAATWRRWKRLPAASEDEDAASTRRRFMTAGGLLMAALFLLAILALAIPAFVHRPCD
jgi:hypothetical protein